MSTVADISLTANPTFFLMMSASLRSGAAASTAESAISSTERMRLPGLRQIFFALALACLLDSKNNPQFFK